MAMVLGCAAAGGLANRAAAQTTNWIFFDDFDEQRCRKPGSLTAPL